MVLSIGTSTTVWKHTLRQKWSGVCCALLSRLLSYNLYVRRVHAFLNINTSAANLHFARPVPAATRLLFKRGSVWQLDKKALSSDPNARKGNEHVRHSLERSENRPELNYVRPAYKSTKCVFVFSFVWQCKLKFFIFGPPG